MHLSKNVLTRRVNTYFAMLLITVIGSGATLFLLHVIHHTKQMLAHSNEAQYSQLQHSLLTQ